MSNDKIELEVMGGTIWALLLSLDSLPITCSPLTGGRGTAEVQLKLFDELRSCSVATQYEYVISTKSMGSCDFMLWILGYRSQNPIG